MRNSLVRIAAESLVAVAALPLVLSSCIKDEAPNSEADITGVTLPDSSVLLREPVISNSDITLYADTPDSILAPTFTLTPGATIEPASGTPRKFFTRQMTVSNTDEGKDTTYTFVSTPQQYTVTSQDGQWKKTYTVNVVNNATPADFHFDNVRYYEYNGEPIFQIFYENVAGQNIDWGSGNAGAMVTLMASNRFTGRLPHIAGRRRGQRQVRQAHDNIHRSPRNNVRSTDSSRKSIPRLVCREHAGYAGINAFRHSSEKHRTGIDERLLQI